MHPARAGAAAVASISRRFAVRVDGPGQRRNLSRRDLSPLPPLPDLISPCTAAAARPGGRSLIRYARAHASQRSYWPAVAAAVSTYARRGPPPSGWFIAVAVAVLHGVALAVRGARTAARLLCPVTVHVAHASVRGGCSFEGSKSIRIQERFSCPIQTLDNE